MNFYIYHNWQANGNQYTIHKWNCGFCHNGFGMHENAERGKNGVWIGPFTELVYAEKYLTGLGINPDNNKDSCI